MTPDTRTLVIVADGERARVFEEARRGGRLTERADWLTEIEAAAKSRPPVGAVHDRMGHALHGLATESRADKAARDFVARLGERLEALVRGERFDALVIFAPPRALGLLRAGLSPALRAKLRHDAPADRLNDTPDTLRDHLRDLRFSEA
ncbi:host attachment protein [Caulobacter sp. 1776]|uniref:host attachment protein n=1 Tax=Caulobacter sp. 1776 TaxID=3156420 RepID=UPI003392BFD7